MAQSDHTITYFVLSQDSIDKLVAEAAQPDRLVKESTACKLFDMSKDTLNELVRTGKVTREVIPGRAKSYRYSLKQIRSNWKPL